METTIKQRLTEYLAHKGIGQTKFETLAGLSRGYINKLNNDMQLSSLRNILRTATDLNREWLETGEGEMLTSHQPVKSSGSGRPYYNVDFLGGFDVMVNDQTSLPAYFIDFAPYNKDGICWCNITGHSMEPKIEHGDIIALKEVQDRRNIEYGDIYAIVTDYDLRTVKIVRRGEDANHLRLIPINKDFDELDVEMSSILRMYKVVCNIKKL